MNIIDTAKQHPYIVGGVALVAVIGVFFLFGGSGSQSVSAPGADPNEIAAGLALQQTQIQAQQQGANIQAGLQAQSENDASQLQLAKIQADASNSLAGIQANVASQEINAQEQTQSLASTLNAQVAEAGLTAQTNQAQINSNTTLGTVSALASVLNQQTNAQIAAINTQGQVQEAQIANQCHGFGCLF